MKAAAQRAPILRSLIGDWRSIVQTFGIVAMTNAAYYVAFTFAGENRPTLDHVGMSVDRGRVVAVVGPTGAGKSTLVELIGGLVVLTGIVLAETSRPAPVEQLPLPA